MFSSNPPRARPTVGHGAIVASRLPAGLRRPELGYCCGMPLRFSLVAAVGLLALAPACSRNEISPETFVPPQPVPSAAPAPTPSLQKVDDSPLPPPVPLEIAYPNKAAPVLGHPCTGGTQCGTKGRVSLRASARYFEAERTTPCKLMSLAPAGPPSPPPMEEPSACLEGGRLYVETRCIPCRLQVWTTVEAEIAELTPQQISNLQKTIAYTGQPLRTASAWQVAITQAHHKSGPSVPN